MSFQQAAIEAALSFYASFFRYEGQRLISSLLGNCQIRIESEMLVIECGSQSIANGLASVDHWLIYAAQWLGLPTVISFRVGSELVRVIDTSSTPINSLSKIGISTVPNLSHLFPPGLSERELFKFVNEHPEMAVLVIEEQVVAASESYCRLTGKTLMGWLTDWVGNGAQRIHGNQSRHLPGVREQLVEDLMRSESGLLLNYEWPAIFSRDHSTRRFKGHFQRVTLGDRTGRMLLLLEEPTPIASPAEVTQGCR